MPKNKPRVKKWKLVVSLVLVFAVFIGSFAGYFALSYQAQAVTNDYTENKVEQPNENTGGEGNDGASAILSKNVKVFTDGDSESINKSITNIKITNFGLYMDVAEGTAFDELGIGDIFYLDGSANTPLGEIYIGKISNIGESGQSRTYMIETPTVDEVFDVLKFDYEQVMSNENISSIQTVEGVNVTRVEDVSSMFSETGTEETETLSVSSPLEMDVVELENSSTTFNGLLFDYKLDLLKAFNLKKEPEFFEKYDAAESKMVKVYKTSTGICYHRENCACLGKSKFEMSLSEAIDEGYEPCYRCNPPVCSDNFEASLNIEGKIGLESISFNIDYDWDILNGNGIENLSVSANGDFLAQTSLKANMKYELSGETTEVSLPLSAVKLQGLKEKLFPLAFVGYNGTVVTSVLGGNQEIRTITGAVPITVGAIIYLDVDGNITVGASANFNCRRELNLNAQIVKDGQWVWDTDFNAEEPEISLGFDTEISGDVDACVGASLSAYVFNLNALEVTLIKIGAESQGNIKLKWETGTQNEASNGLSGSYYMRAYLKILGIDVKIKIKLSLWALSVSKELSSSKLLVDHTIAEWGTRNLTRFSPGIMSYTSVTAKDSNAIYYKNTDDMLMKEEDGYSTVLYDQDFFSICGIDESYIYLTRVNDNNLYNIYRVSKSDGTNKKIAEDVYTCLTTDEYNIYYVSDFDHTAIRRLNRETLKDEQLASFDYDVKFMDSQDGGYYVVTEESGFFAQFFGAESNCCMIDSDGNIISEYGSSPEVLQYFMTDFGSFYQAARILSGGYLRSTATEIYWVSKDKKNMVLTESISGWNQNEFGIFTTILKENVEGEEYKIVLYRAEDGARIDVTDAVSNQAFFTLCHSSNGEWYFFDQTDENMILYAMSGDFKQKRVVKTFALSEIPYNLTDCGMVIMDNRIYFYTMPDNTTSKVLYRYDIV